MGIKEYSPQYYIRIFSRGLGEINPNNVISINTNIDLNQATGTWEMTFDYRNSALDTNSWFFAIEPMDYVEIYLRRDPGKIGLVETEGAHIGEYTGYTPGLLGSTEEETKTVVELFREGVLTEQEIINSNIATYDNTSNVPFRKNVPLFGSQRRFNPDLVMTGFVDDVGNSFNISANSTNNLVTIRGRTVSKYLQMHSVNPALDVWSIWEGKIQEVMKRYTYGLQVLPMNTPAANIALILKDLAKEILQEQFVEKETTGAESVAYQHYTTEKIEQFRLYPTSTGDAYRKVEDKTVYTYRDPIDYIWAYDIWGHPFKTESVTKTIRERKQVIEYKELDRQDKHSRLMETSSAQIDQAKAGFNIQYSSLWSILSQIAHKPLHEFFIDERGYVVLRRMISLGDVPDDNVQAIDKIGAWDQPKYGPSIEFPYHTEFRSHYPKADKSGKVSNWIEISDADVMQWNFSRNDNELKTLVQATPGMYAGGDVLQTLAQVGYAPLSAIGIKNTSLTDDIKVKLVETVLRRQASNLYAMPLGTGSELLAFWRRYGVRCLQFLDIYSMTPDQAFISAYSTFEKFASLWWTGTFTLKGDPKYRIGKFIEYPAISARFYVNKVTHNFVWGQNYTTKIGFTRGEKLTYDVTGLRPTPTIMEGLDIYSFKRAMG